MFILMFLKEVNDRLRSIAFKQPLSTGHNRVCNKKTSARKWFKIKFRHQYHRHKSGWNSGDTEANQITRRLSWGRGVGSTGKGSGEGSRPWEGLCPLPRRNDFCLKWRVLVNSERYFLNTGEQFGGPDPLILWPATHPVLRRARLFGRPFVKRFALCYRTAVCLVCL